MTQKKGQKKPKTDNTRLKRQQLHLERLREGGGAPVRADFHGPDLDMLDELVEADVGPTRAETLRILVRERHARLKKKP